MVGLLGGCTGLNPLFAEASEDGGGGPTSTTSVGTGSAGSGDSVSSSSTTLSSLGTAASFDTSADSSGDTVADSTGEGTSTEDSGSETTEPDPAECSTFAQECAAGQKCMPYADGDGESWNALGCFPVDPTPNMPADSCTVVSSAASGMDDCDEVSMCWFVDGRTNVGTCTRFCTGSARTPGCLLPDDSCFITNGGVLALCLPQCDPLEQSCGEGQACLPADDGFVCTPDASQGGPMTGEPCEFFNECGAGNLCMDDPKLIECGGPACCTSFCDLSAGDLCGGPFTCLPYYEPGMTPPGLENVGICADD